MRAFTNFAYGVGLLMMLPVSGTGQPVPVRESVEIISLASDRFKDVEFLCASHKTVCETVADMALTIERNAKAGLRVVSSWLEDTLEYKAFSPAPQLAAFLAPETAGRLRPSVED